MSEAVAGLGTVEEVMKYLEPERWQLDMEDLYKPTWHILGKSFLHNKKSRGTATAASQTANNRGSSDRNCSGRKVCHVEMEGKTDKQLQLSITFHRQFYLEIISWQLNLFYKLMPLFVI